MIWGGGRLANWGVLDFAGGIVVHATAGFAALASVFYVGKRRDTNYPPNSIPLVIINLITTVKTTSQDQEIGIDQALHGEKAYDEGAL